MSTHVKSAVSKQNVLINKRAQFKETGAYTMASIQGDTGPQGDIISKRLCFDVHVNERRKS